jgi:hypothetical protein
VKYALLMIALVACGGDLDQPWDLDHDRIVAIRATPPGILSGETSTIDGLIAHVGAPTEEKIPDLVVVASPESLASTLAFTGGQWTVTAPSEEQLDAARTELGLEAGAVVPLQLGVAFAKPGAMNPEDGLFGLKTIGLGFTAPNPTLGVMEINGEEAPAPDVELVIGKLVDVPLLVPALETDEVNWLTSVGTMHDFDLPSAYVRVEEEDPTEGQLAVVLRDDRGGVTWQLWPMRAE